VQVRNVMTRDVFTVGPDSFVTQAAEVMAERGFAALPVVDEDNRLVGIVGEADVLRDRLLPDPRLHLRRDGSASRPAPPRLVRGVMTVGVRSVEAAADVADVARIFIHEHVRSVPVMEHGRTVGIVSRRDLLRGLVRPDESIRTDLLRVVEDYTGELGCWDIVVSGGVATIRREAGSPGVSARVEDRALVELAATVVGVVSIRVLDSVPGPPSPPTLRSSPHPNRRAPMKHIPRQPAPIVGPDRPAATARTVRVAAEVPRSGGGR
jgi:CBS domain-containing protein